MRQSRILELSASFFCNCSERSLFSCRCSIKYSSCSRCRRSRSKESAAWLHGVRLFANSGTRQPIWTSASTIALESVRLRARAALCISTVFSVVSSSIFSSRWRSKYRHTSWIASQSVSSSLRRRSDSGACACGCSVVREGGFPVSGRGRGSEGGRARGSEGGRERGRDKGCGGGVGARASLANLETRRGDETNESVDWESDGRSDCGGTSFMSSFDNGQPVMKSRRLTESSMLGKRPAGPSEMGGISAIHLKASSGGIPRRSHARRHRRRI